MFGNGRMFSSARDLGVLLQMLLDGGRSSDHRVLSPESADMLLRTHNDKMCTGDNREIQPGCGYSFGVACVDDSARYQGDAPEGTMWWGGSTNTLFFYRRDVEAWGVFLTHTFPFGHEKAIFRFEKLAAAL